jgi:hypothetical protein
MNGRSAFRDAGLVIDLDAIARGLKPEKAGLVPNRIPEATPSMPQVRIDGPLFGSSLRFWARAA